jgi:tripartite-type tricarboxylate transporter receptor subunit TctC
MTFILLTNPGFSPRQVSISPQRPKPLSTRRLAIEHPRRRLLRLAAGAAMVPGLSRLARAQVYPSRPVRLIVGFPAGGPTDIVARVIAQYLSERLGKAVIVENRPGAASNIAAEGVARAAPDGYTLLEITATNAINSTLYQHLSFDISRDLVPAAGIIRTPTVMEVSPAFPAKSLPEFIAHAKANPGKINMTSGGLGSPGHVAGELFKIMTGIDMVHVPYRGSAPALTDLLGGQVQVMFDSLPSSIEYVRGGKLRALAVTSATRWGGLPDVPAVSEFVSGFEASGWFGIGAPRNTPVDIIELLNKSINAALSDPKMAMRFAELGGTTLPGSPMDFGKLIAAETEKWGKVVRAANIKPE